VTPKQLECKTRQLLYRRKLSSTIEDLEESIKAHMLSSRRNRIIAGLFVISLKGEDLSIRLMPKIDSRQLKLRLKALLEERRRHELKT